MNWVTFRDRTRCCCVPDNKWWNSRHQPSEELNTYVRYVMEVMSNGGPMLSLADLRKGPEATSGSIYMVRGNIQTRIPFKPTMCRASQTCCGTCMHPCQTRCVQDLFNKFYLRCNMYFTSKIPIEKADLETKVIVQSLRNPNVTYRQLCQLYNETFTLKYHEDLRAYAEEVLDGEHPYRYNYEPQPLRILENGKADSDPLTGEIYLNNWPASGLCPYCLPAITHRTVRGDPAAEDRIDRAKQKLAELRMGKLR